MNKPLSTPKTSKRTFLIILLIAIGLHLIILSPWITPFIGFNQPKDAPSLPQVKPKLSLSLIDSAPKEAHVKKDNQVQAPVSQTSTEIEGYIDLTSSSSSQSNLLDPLEGAPNTEFETDNKLIDDTAPFHIEGQTLEAPVQTLSQSLESTQADHFDSNYELEATGEELENVFSEQTKTQLMLAKEAQAEYENAQVEEEEYAITEDSDGTRYVNIKGVCWRIPPPGSEEAWTIVYAGCSGQTKTFNLEINIGMDILGPDSPFATD